MSRCGLTARKWIGAGASAGVMLLAASGCDDGGEPDPVQPRPPGGVQFVYRAPTAVDPSVAQRFPGCVSGVGQTHIHPSWMNFARVNMTAVGSDRWEIAFSDVPVNEDLRIRVSDPNACATSPTGASTQNVFANDVLLTRVVDTPGSGIEPGLGFRLNADGTVTP